MSLLPYWIEHPNTTSTTNIWVNCDSLPNGTASFYISYGNSSATTTESGADTFSFFDDFLGVALDTGKWVSWGSPTVTVSNSEMKFKGANNYVGIYNSVTFGYNYSLRSRVKMDSTSDGQSIGFESSGSPSHILYGRVSAPAWALRTSIGGTETTTTITSDTNYHIVDLSRISGLVTLILDGTATVTSTTNLPTTSLTFPTFTSWAIATYIYSDWVLVRPYVSSEPTVTTWGIKEPLVSGGISLGSANMMMVG